MDMPTTPADGAFTSFEEWVNKATSWIGGTNSACFDSKGRRCKIGYDFMLARDENAFPVWFWHGLGDQTLAEQRKCARLALGRTRSQRRMRRGIY